MVKIVNPMGDVKIGRQGEVVYQRHYGQQTRRLVSPKRAIASETQIAHRQLYRDALDWRKSLSRPNRRYLEGYCIANGVVDSYHIPLPWHRFALKCYLEHIHFVLITKPIAGEEGYEGKFEKSEVFNTYRSFRAQYWDAMTFTPLQAHTLTHIGLWLYRGPSSAGNFTASIRNTDGVGHPTGIDLSTYTCPAGDIDYNPPAKEYFFELDTPLAVSASVKLAIVMRAPSLPGGNFMYHAQQSASPPYPRGNLERSVNSGSSWITDNPDVTFYEWGYLPGEEGTKGLVHVRHPALLTVVHKRGEATIHEYENLSSLDEEYLTKQVGIDVEAGDTIKATTVGGIEYNYTIH